MGSNKAIKKSTKAEKKSSKKVVEKVESSSSSSSSSSESASSESEASSDEEEEKVEEAKVEEEKAEKSGSDSSDSESGSGSDSASSDEEEAEETTDKKRKASEDSEEEPAAKVAKVEEQATYTVWCGGISWDSKEDDVKEFFEQCGEISEVRIRLDNATGKNKGFCHIDFTTKAAHDAALALSGSEFMGRSIRLDSAGDGSNRQPKKDENYGPKSTKVFIANLNRDYDEESHRASLTESFSQFGTLVGDIRLPYNREEGTLRGIGYLEFETPEQAEAAVKGMNGVEVNGRPLRTDFSGNDDRERVSRGGFRGGRGGNDRGGRGGGRGGFSDRGGGRGGRGGFSDRGGGRGGRGGFSDRGGGRGGRGGFNDRGGRGGGRGGYRG